MEPITSYGLELQKTLLAFSTLADDHPLRRADGAVCMGGVHYLWDLFISRPIAARCGSSLSVGTAGSAASTAHKRKVTNYTTAYDFTAGTLVPLSFETGGYADPDTIALLKRYVKYACLKGLHFNLSGRARREPNMLVACTSFVPPSPSPLRALLPTCSFTGRTRSW